MRTISISEESRRSRCWASVTPPNPPPTMITLRLLIVRSPRWLFSVIPPGPGLSDLGRKPSLKMLGERHASEPTANYDHPSFTHSPISSLVIFGHSARPRPFRSRKKAVAQDAGRASRLRTHRQL